MPSRLRRFASYAFAAAGLALLIYVSVQYGTMYSEQRRLVRQWEEQNAAAGARSPARPAADGLTRITIAKINLDAVVVEGTNARQLLVGPGRIQESALPGTNGNTVITGHRDTFFRHIYELGKGDLIELKRDGTLYRYEVTGKRVVDPSDVSVLRQTTDPQLTLITCYPTYFIGPAPERLVVFAKLLDSHGEAAQAAKAGGAQ